MTPDLEDWRRALLERRAALLRERMSAASDDGAVRPAEKTLAEVLDALGARELNHLQEIADAILRLDAGRFGRCVDCDEPIAIERLRASPEAARCTSCANHRARARRRRSAPG